MAAEESHCRPRPSLQVGSAEVESALSRLYLLPSLLSFKKLVRLRTAAHAATLGREGFALGCPEHGTKWPNHIDRVYLQLHQIIYTYNQLASAIRHRRRPAAVHEK